ncbi:MAG: glycosyltransferase [Clostridiales bacterium]|nr:glycosyltransferase [Clostridiales bacterium]
MEKDSVIISIIVPVYNSDIYLPECLDSILSSDGVEETEIIIVDDGSTDRSGIISDDYSCRYSNIKVVHKKNEGVADARNVGLFKATGKYVFFLDADDMVVPSMFSRIIRQCRDVDVDVIMWDGELIDEAGHCKDGRERDYFSHKGIDDCIMSGQEYLMRQLEACKDFPTVVWLGAYKKDYLIDNELFFKNKLHHEDDLWVPMVLINSKLVKYVSGRLYLYRIHSDSLSHPDRSNINEYIESLLIIYPFLFNYIDETISDVKLRKMLKGNLTRKYLHWIFEYDFSEFGYGDKIDKKLLWKNSNRFRDKLRVIVLFIKG